ncbi:MAG: hypothetical protein A2Z02_00425 [Chloroflexi bacterium RBG_16_48_7]|nr:MAG: hypothetical protein A2Z02_00425 [Chloroflexi bacterium RBG_16_48_7]
MIKAFAIIPAILLSAALLLSCNSPSVPASVVEIIDGDTVRIEGNISVRYLGVDTPEIGEPYYIESKYYNARLLQGRKITLQIDITDKDAYGRLLRYVYADTVMVNTELVRQGYAFVYAKSKFPDNKNYDIFKSALDEAIGRGKGIWSSKTHPKLNNKDDYYLPSSFLKQ